MAGLPYPFNRSFVALLNNGQVLYLNSVLAWCPNNPGWGYIPIDQFVTFMNGGQLHLQPAILPYNALADLFAALGLGVPPPPPLPPMVPALWHAPPPPPPPAMQAALPVPPVMVYTPQELNVMLAPIPLPVDVSTDPCSICYAELLQMPVTVLSCGHFFHIQCIHTWLSTPHEECPFCRQLPDIAAPVLPPQHVGQAIYDPNGAQGPGDAAPQGPGDAAPQGPGDAAPQGPGDAAPQGPGDAAPQSPGEAEPSDEGKMIKINFIRTTFNLFTDDSIEIEVMDESDEEVTDLSASISQQIMEMTLMLKVRN